jgi:hypothetical protein
MKPHSLPDGCTLIKEEAIKLPQIFRCLVHSKWVSWVRAVLPTVQSYRTCTAPSFAICNQMRLSSARNLPKHTKNRSIVLNINGILSRLNTCRYNVCLKIRKKCFHDQSCGKIASYLLQSRRSGFCSMCFI